MGFLKKIGLEPFIIMLFGSILLAYIYPPLGMEREGGVSLGDIANWGVSFIFFFYGMRLNREKLKAGLVNVRLHILVHVSTFLLFPLIMLAAMWAGGAFGAKGNDYYLWMGAFFLATLPSTVSSSVVMVSIAGGNMAAAIFNASVSSLIGVFMTPLWMGLFLENIDGTRNLGDVILKLVVQVLIPVAAGGLLNPKFGRFAEKYKKALRMFDETVILLIVYTSFCDSFHKKMFEGFSAAGIIGLSAAMVALFFAAYGIIWCAAVCISAGVRLHRGGAAAHNAIPRIPAHNSLHNREENGRKARIKPRGLGRRPPTPTAGGRGAEIP